MNALFNKLPRVNICCFFVPLQIGAFIVTAWTLVWYAYTGIVVMTLSLYSSSIASTIFLKGLGACYLLLALGAFYGAHAIYYQIPHRVAKFVQGYFVAIIFYTMAQIVYIIVVQIAVSAAIANAKAQCEKASKGTNVNCDAYTGSYGFPIVSWLIPYAIGSLWQLYLFICIRSYSLELTERSEKPGQYNGP
ncbi:hypothetical protein F8M41_014351 [Gigaspora margarita]|uniref:Uncharacterized protein n=1 Tax=Gigaspora margarita TaxID=4874 RepID=A0A8H3ZXS0_GIGMA|nr:hypothetical protein F8M41_014351 [Gigaspora margarita]